MDEFSGWISTANEQERLLAFWLYGDIWVDADVTPSGPLPVGAVAHVQFENRGVIVRYDRTAIVRAREA